MPWKCTKCGYETVEYEGKECPDCGGRLKESDSEADWLTDKEDGDLNNPNATKKENPDNDILL